MSNEEIAAKIFKNVPVYEPPFIELGLSVCKALDEKDNKIDDLKAENTKLREALKSPNTWQHRCSDGVGGCTAISESARKEALSQSKQELETP